MSNSRVYSAPPAGPLVPFTNNLSGPNLIAIDHVHQFFYVVTFELNGWVSVHVLDGFAADENIFSVRSLIELPPFLDAIAMAVDAELGLCYILILGTPPTLYLVNRDVFLGSKTLLDYSTASSLVVDPVSHCVFIADTTTNTNPILTKYCWM
jgi:hypothetical protein